MKSIRVNLAKKSREKRKVEPADIAEMKAERASGISAREIAEKRGLAECTVRDYCSGRLWGRK